MYSTYSDFCESHPTENKKVVILGGGPNRIGKVLNLITVVSMHQWHLEMLAMKQ